MHRKTIMGYAAARLIFAIGCFAYVMSANADIQITKTVVDTSVTWAGVCFLDRGTGYAFGISSGKNRMGVTFDGGQNWQIAEANSTITFSDNWKSAHVFAAGPDTIFTVLSGMRVESFQMHAGSLNRIMGSALTDQISNFAFVDDTTGFAIRSIPIDYQAHIVPISIFQTSNGGRTWESKAMAWSLRPYDFRVLESHFNERAHCVCKAVARFVTCSGSCSYCCNLGDPDTMYFYSDNLVSDSVSWETYPSFDYLYFFRPDERELWQIASDTVGSTPISVLQQSLNGGRSWSTQYLAQPGDALNAVFKIANNDWWATGNNGLLLHISDTDATTIAEKSRKASRLPGTGLWVRASTSQGFSINYALDKPSSVTLSLRNVSGQEIATPMRDQPQAAGAHSLLWNGDDGHGQGLSAGVYYVELMAGKERLWSSIVKW